MKDLKLQPPARREVKALVRLVPWVVISLLLAAVLWRADLSATSGLFQSPPQATSTPMPTTPAPTDTPTIEPTEMPAEEPTATEEPSATPTEESMATETPTPTPVPPTPTEVPPTVTPVPMPTESATASGDSRYTQGETNLKFEWGKLFDAVALGVSYLWLCCGIMLLPLLLLFFGVLWIASHRRRQQAGGTEEQ